MEAQWLALTEFFNRASPRSRRRLRGIDLDSLQVGRIRLASLPPQLVAEAIDDSLTEIWSAPTPRGS